MEIDKHGVIHCQMFDNVGSSPFVYIVMEEIVSGVRQCPAKIVHHIVENICHLLAIIFGHYDCCTSHYLCVNVTHLSYVL